MKINLPPGKTFWDALEEDNFNNSFPQSNTNNINTNEVLYKVFETSETGIFDKDHTGRFPYRSS